MTNAAAISGVLRRLGFRPVGGDRLGREGIRVYHRFGGGARVVADLDSEVEAARLSAEAEVALVELGRYAITRTAPNAFTVELAR